MRVGIDLGTTRTVVAAVDRGNYPVLGMEDVFGDQHDHLPTVVALDGERIVCGWEALALNDGQAPQARSFKRLLSSPDVTAATAVPIGAEHRLLGEVLETFARHVLEQVRRSLGADEAEPIQAVLGVPAHAHSAQRLLTLDAFARAGAEVIALVNEPSAGAFEFTHRHPRALTSRRTGVVVYDLGGGTFDASVVRINGTDHDVERSTGLARLGGDDFDAVLARLAAEQIAAEQITAEQGSSASAPCEAELLEAARLAKERITPQSRRTLVELPEADVAVRVDAFYEQAAPLVEATLEVMEPLLAEGGALADTELAGIYLVGGATALPLVARMLRDRFGRRVHRSPHPSASTAIGLAIAADPEAGFRLRDRLTRGIGVFREARDGAEVTFDPLVAPGTVPAEDGSITVVRRYRAAHNVGWFRYVEFPAAGAGETTGDLTALAEVVVPFDPELRDGRDLTAVPVKRCENGPEVEETVRIDANGIATIRTVLEDGYCVERSVG